MNKTSQHSYNRFFRININLMPKKDGKFNRYIRKYRLIYVIINITLFIKFMTENFRNEIKPKFLYHLHITSTEIGLKYT
jgi:hypothetical protein